MKANVAQSHMAATAIGAILFGFPVRIRPVMNLPRALTSVTLIAAIVVLAACDQQSAKPAGRGSSGPVGVHITPVRSDAWVDRIEALGTARANESVVLSAKVVETVSRVNFDDGQWVSEGAVLVELTDRAEVASLKEAQAAFAEARKQAQRLQNLVKQGTVPRSAVDQQEALRDQSRARMEAIRARLADRVITAPFDGQLGFRRVSPGTLVTVGTEIATLDDIATIKLDFPVPERFLAALNVGQEIEASSSAWPDQTFTGTVSSIDSRVDPATRTLTVRALVSNAERKLRPGMLLIVELLTPPRQSLVIDEISLVQIGTDAFVYRIDDDNKAERAVVELGRRAKGRIEILSGLELGDRVVTDGVVKLRPGVAVQILEQAVATDVAAAPQ